MLFRTLVASVAILTALPLASAMPLSHLFANSTEYHQLQRRVDTVACRGKFPFEFFIRRSSVDLNKQTGPDDCRLPDGVLPGRGYELPPTTVSRQEFQVFKNDNYKAMTNLEIGAVTGPGTHTCDHILEVGVVKGVLETPGGVCDVAKELIDAADGDQTKIDDVKKKLNNIVIILNGPANLVFLQSSVEKIKGTMVNWVRRLNPNPVEIKSTKKKGKKTTTYSGGKGFWLPGGLLDYFDKTAAISNAVADKIDEAIKEDFPTAETDSGVRNYWENIYVKRMKKELVDVQKAAVIAIGEAACDAPTGASGSFSRRTTLRSDPGFELYSSLTARAAAGRVKSGPKAPPGRSCPLKNAKQKQVVPRSQAQTKPKPATKPRVPTTRPQPRPPSPKKRVVPRPANRPKRAVGQPAKQKRTTPRTKPRVVPKPTQRPRGKPRARRRR